MPNDPSHPQPPALDVDYSGGIQYLDGTFVGPAPALPPGSPSLDWCDQQAAMQPGAPGECADLAQLANAGLGFTGRR
jgi:hypothetical protein